RRAPEGRTRLPPRRGRIADRPAPPVGPRPRQRAGPRGRRGTRRPHRDHAPDASAGPRPGREDHHPGRRAAPGPEEVARGPPGVRAAVARFPAVEGLAMSTPDPKLCDTPEADVLAELGLDAAEQQHLAHQGFVRPEYRYRNGRRWGPFYKLRYRIQGRV